MIALRVVQEQPGPQQGPRENSRQKDSQPARCSLCALDIMNLQLTGVMALRKGCNWKGHDWKCCSSLPWASLIPAWKRSKTVQDFASLNDSPQSCLQMPICHESRFWCHASQCNGFCGSMCVSTRTRTRTRTRTHARARRGAGCELDRADSACRSMPAAGCTAEPLGFMSVA